MEDPYRSPSSPSMPRPPPKRWYVLFGDMPGPWVVLTPVFVGSLATALGFIEVGFTPWVIRALVVVAIFAAAWCAAFLRRGHNPPKDALVFGGDDA